VGNDFYSSGTNDAMAKHHQADPEEALQVTDAALEAYQASGAKTENLAYAQLVDLRVGFYAEAGNAQSAIPEVNAMVDDLAARGANASVVAELRSLAPEPPPTPRTRKVTKSPRKRPAKKTPKRN
jgi:hypothetical protein